MNKRRTMIAILSVIAIISAGWIGYLSIYKPVSGGNGHNRLAMTVFAPQGTAPWEENLFTRWIENRFHVNLKWSLAPGNALKEVRQMMLAGDEYPDVFLEGKFTSTELLVYGKQGVLIPLNELIEKHAPNIRKMMETNEEFREALIAPDGNIYGIPRFNECYHCNYAQKFWINRQWLDTLGLNVPQTTDELFTVLKAFKERDPNGNGLQDEIPLTGAPEKNVWHGNIDAYLMNAFIYNDNDKYLLLENGKVDFAANKPGWRSGLQYMHKLYKEGLIDPASFTQSAEALSQLGNREGDELAGSVTAAMVSYLVNPYDPALTRHLHWTVVPPLMGPEGVQYAGMTRGIGEFQFAITDKATPEMQKAAIRIADYTYSEEGSLYSEYGVLEGIGWKMADPDEKNIDGKPAKYSYYRLDEEEPDAVVNERWSLMGPKDLSKRFRDLFAEGQDPLSPTGYGRRLAQATEIYQPYAPQEVYPSGVYILPDDVETIAVLNREIKEYVRLNMIEFIIGTKSIEDEWNDYVRGFHALNLSKYIEIYQKAISFNSE
ncbi:ABC transporter substrate-binding protein [Paenibacillus tarimensis]